MKKEQIALTFLGTGTSQGVPVIACNCEVCQSEDIKDKRLRSSVLFSVNGKNIVIDTGPDFRQQMLENEINQLDAVVFTHAHKDHTAGLDDIRSFNFAQKKDMQLYCEKHVLEQLTREFEYIFDKKFNYPGIPRVETHIITNKPFKIDDVEVTPIRGLHYKLPVLGFRIQDYAYITDMNQISDDELLKLKNLDVFVINALRKEPHLSHFKLSEALEIIQKLKPKKAYLTHISHHLGKHQEIEKQLPKNVALACDGLTV